jgi:hypothetical protein
MLLFRISYLIIELLFNTLINQSVTKAHVLLILPTRKTRRGGKREGTKKRRGRKG